MVHDLIFELGAKFKAEKSIWKNLVFDKFQQNHTLTCDVIMTSLKDRKTLLKYMNWKI